MSNKVSTSSRKEEEPPYAPKRIAHSYGKANSFVLAAPGSNKKLLIDAGGPDFSLYTNIIGEKELSAILLTHEHADHCLLLDQLVDYYRCPVYASELAAQNIKDYKQNFSFYIEEIPTFTAKTAIQVLYDGKQLNFDGINVTAYETPGHSPGSMCYVIEDQWFTGDTILNSVKTPLSFPHSNRKQYSDSVKKLINLITIGDSINPGHDTAFLFKDADALLKGIEVNPSILLSK